MTLVEKADLDALLPALLRVYPLGDPAKFRCGTVEAITLLIPFDGLFFSTMLSPGHSLEDVTFRGLEEGHVDRAARLANTLIKETFAHLEGTSPTVIRLSDLITFDQLKALPHYAILLEPHGLRYELDAHFFHDGALAATLSIFRRPERGDFSNRDKAILEYLYPHVTLALGNLVRARATQADPLEEPDGSCALVFDEGGQLTAWSELATQLLRAEADRVGLLVAHAADSPLVQELSQRVRTGASGRGLLKHQGLGNIRYALERRADGKVTARLEAPQFTNAAYNSARLGLTLREYEIVRHLAAGATAREIGERLEITIHTARTHIKNIYEKLGVANRAELVRRIARGSAPPRPTSSE